MTKKRILSLIAAVIAICISLSGCNNGKKGNDVLKDLDPNDRITELTMPISKEPITLSVFAYMHPNVAKNFKSWAELESVKEFMSKTGITLTFRHPPNGQEKEQFNIMVASNDLTDLVYAGFNNYKGGPEAAMEEGLILEFDDLIDRYAPNYKRELLNDPDFARMVKSDSNKIIKFGVSKIPHDAERPFIGPMIRSDLLAKTGLPMPETIDEWTTLLRAMKTNGVEVPLAWGSKDWDPMRVGNVFSSAYGVPMKGYYRENGTVKYGPIEPAYKEYLTQLNAWYVEGLLDKDFATHSPVENVPSMLMSGKSAAAALHLETAAKFYTSVNDPNITLEPAPMPKLNKNDQIKLLWNYSGIDSQGYYISAKCKYPKEAVQMIDALYLPENCLMFNVGKEGVTYEMVNDEIVMLDVDPKIRSSWSLGSMCGIVNKKINEMQYTRPEQQKAWDVWSVESREGMMPDGLIMSQEQSDKFTQRMTDIETYADEMFIKFIMGLEPLSNFDNYVNTIKGMNIDEAISIKQENLDKYESRK